MNNPTDNTSYAPNAQTLQTRMFALDQAIRNTTEKVHGKARTELVTERAAAFNKFLLFGFLPNEGAQVENKKEPR